MKHSHHDYISPRCGRSMMQSISCSKCSLPLCSSPHAYPGKLHPLSQLASSCAETHPESQEGRWISLNAQVGSNCIQGVTGGAVCCCLPLRLILPSLPMMRSWGESQSLLKTKAIQLFSSYPKCKATCQTKSSTVTAYCRIQIGIGCSPHPKFSKTVLLEAREKFPCQYFVYLWTPISMFNITAELRHQIICQCTLYPCTGTNQMLTRTYICELFKERLYQ